MRSSRLKNKNLLICNEQAISEDEVEHCDPLCNPVSGFDGGTDAAKGIQRHSRALQSTRADRSPAGLSARIRREQPRRGKRYCMLSIVAAAVSSDLILFTLFVYTPIYKFYESGGEKGHSLQPLLTNVG